MGNPPESPPTPSSNDTLRHVARLVGRVLLLLVATAATIAAVAWYIPEVNSYARASALKHRRLEQLDSPKIVVVGGSNLAFGLDSAMIEQATGRGVVNMGMDGFLGVRFMLAEVEPFIASGDLVVVAFEHGAYYNDEDGSAGNQFAVVKAYPQNASLLSQEQQLAILWEAPRKSEAKRS